MTESIAVPRGAALWWMAARPRTLAASIAPVVVGTAAAAHAGALHIVPAILAMLSSLFIQIGTNFANDYSDFKRGADAERVGPRRVTQSGLVQPHVVKRAAWIAFGISGLFGLALAGYAGWPIIAIGIVSVACGWLYTGGPWPLGYHGLGDVFVFVFFGMVATCGTAYAEALFVPREAIFAGAAMGCLSTAILVVNNLRDRDTDAKVGKNTLAVRLGVTGTRVEYCALLLIAFALPFFIGRPWPLFALLLAFAPLKRVLTVSGGALNAALGETARMQLAFAVLLAVELWR
jgi:1,4-dihydroxy-2-naphthoate octaprenyltransferase